MQLNKKHANLAILRCSSPSIKFGLAKSHQENGNLKGSQGQHDLPRRKRENLICTTEDQQSANLHSTDTIIQVL